MLEQILDYIHNYFIKEVISGDFSIVNGSVEGLTLLDGQYFKIVGSVLNDGVYQYPVDGLHDEQFTGEVWAMAVPPSVIALSDEVSDWVDKYGSIADGPYQSENFGGYSYTKKSSSGQSNDGASGWQGVFGSRLNRWRKIS